MPNLFGPPSGQSQAAPGSPGIAAGNHEVDPVLAEQFRISMRGKPTAPPVAPPVQSNSKVDPGLIMSLFQALSPKK